jgi:hypothetical protein
MAEMATQPKTDQPLRGDANLGEVIDAVNALIAKTAGRERVSPSVPIDAVHPSASIVYSDAEYDALVDRLEAAPAPNERLRRTLASRPTRTE